ncbi:phenyloxazoline synthase MbtB [soil metagenome]
MNAGGGSPQTIRKEVAELLGVSADSVDTDADLIGQGLDSIRMMTLSGRWRKRGLDVDFATLAANPTVLAWAELLTDPSADMVEGTAPTTESDRAADQPFALAPMQHAMWVGRNDNQQLGGVAGHLYVEFDGSVADVERLRSAAAALTARHPMLRVEFLPDGTQRIRGDGPQLIVDDLRGLDECTVAARLVATREAKSHQRLDGEVLELTLSLQPGGHTRLHVDLDMQAADAVSYRALMTDLALLYRGAELAPLDYTYRQYRTAMTGPAGPVPRAGDVDWWRERLPQLPDAPALPLTPPAERADPRRSTRRWHWLRPRTKDSLFDAAHRRGITPAMAVAASFSGALARWSTVPRFLLNVPMFGREPLAADIDKLVGDFTSSLLLDIDLAGVDTALGRARTVQDTVHTAAAHASYPGLSVLRDLSRHRGNQVLAPVVFTSALGLGELFSVDVTSSFGTPVWIISQGPQVLLDAQVTEVDGGVLINWDVREDAFRPGVIDAMFAHHIAELERLAAGTGSWEQRDGSAVPAEQCEVRAALNDVSAARSPDGLHDGFFRTADTQPDAPAVVGHLGAVTYAELRSQALAVAATLRARGVGPGDVVAVLGPKNAEQIPALLGIHAAGAAYVPIGIDQPDHRAAHMLQTVGARIALVCGHGEPSVAVDCVPVATAVRDGAGRGHQSVCGSTGLAYILFTSGSTGEPKGVEVSHQAAMNTVEFLIDHFGIGPADRCLALSPLESDMSVPEIFGTLRAGGTIVMVDEDERRDPDTWARLIAENAVTALNWMPGWLQMLIEVDRAADGGRLSSLRAISAGGDWVRVDLVRAFRRAAPGVRFAGLGGATETAIHSTICEPDELPADWVAVPFGAPLPNNACRVVAADGSDCPDWVPGELWVSGRGIAEGYRGRPDLTAQRFVSHDDRIWYRTGDLVRYLPGGSMDFVGRADHRVKVSGYRIELGEVDAALSRVDGVGDAVTAVLPVAGGRGTEQLAAVIAVTDPTLTAGGVTRALQKLLPPHMIPSHLALAERIPFTVGGKIDRAAVDALLVASLAERAAVAQGAELATPLEKALARIVGELLARGDVGGDDDFFALGGDSVLATALVARIRQWLDAPAVMVADIFAARTVSELAHLLTTRDGDRLSAVAEIYLDVVGMDDAEVLSALDSTAAR